MTYYHKKYITFYTGESFYEYPPKMYLDFYTTKPNLKLSWRSSYEFTLSAGIFGHCFILNVRWGFTEREKTEREKEFIKNIEEMVQKSKEKSSEIKRAKTAIDESN